MLATFAATAAVLTAAACGSTASENLPDPAATQTGVATSPAASAVSLSQTGSTLLYPLFSEWGAIYHETYPNIRIATRSAGSGAGIAQVVAGAVDIGASDAYLSEGDVSARPGLLNIALGVSAQQINYNLPGLDGVLKLNGQILAGMYRGDIKTWDDPQIAEINPDVELPDTTVVPLHRFDGSGDTFLFTQYLAKQDPEGWGQAPGYGTTVDFPAVPDALGEHGNGGMITGCAANPGCVTYVSVGFREQARGLGLGEAQLANSAGNYLSPDADAISAAVAGFVAETPAGQAVSLVDGPAPDGYPIVNYEYAIVDSEQKDAAMAQTLQAFLHWALTDGSSPALLEKAGLQPLPEPVTQQSITQIAKIHA